MNTTSKPPIGTHDAVVATGALTADTTSSPTGMPMPIPSPFASRFLNLPTELQTQILLFLSPDELGVLSSVPQLSGIEKDEYLRTVWMRRTVPSRLSHFFAYRPDPLELVRRGTLRGIAIVNSIRNGTYWASNSAVRLSMIHERLTQSNRRRFLTAFLGARPTRESLIERGILPVPNVRGRLASKIYTLERQRRFESIKHALVSRGVGSKGFLEVRQEAGGLWSREEERVLLAVCPVIKQKQRFYEELSAASSPAPAVAAVPTTA